MRLHYLVAQALERIDVREDLLSASERLLCRVGQRWNVAIVHALFQLFELGQVLVDFEQCLRVRKLHELRQRRIEIVDVLA